jgi:glycerol-3-phosphate dehydrogenase
MAGRFGIAEARAATLLERYGTAAERILAAGGASPDRMLASLPSYGSGEIRALVDGEHVVDLDDLIFRRTSIAFSGQLTTSAIEELAGICATVLDWSEAEKGRQIARVRAIATERHGVRLSDAAMAE